MEAKTLTLVERGRAYLETREGPSLDNPIWNAMKLINDMIDALEAAQKALEPFARGADTWDQNAAHARVFTTVADLRLARSVHSMLIGEDKTKGDIKEANHEG